MVFRSLTCCKWRRGVHRTAAVVGHATAKDLPCSPNSSDLCRVLSIPQPSSRWASSNGRLNHIASRRAALSSARRVHITAAPSAAASAAAIPTPALFRPACEARRHYASSSSFDSPPSNAPQQPEADPTPNTNTNGDNNNNTVDEAHDGAYSTTTPWTSPEEETAAVQKASLMHASRPAVTATTSTMSVTANAEDSATPVETNTSTNASAEEEICADESVEDGASITLPEDGEDDFKGHVADAPAAAVSTATEAHTYGDAAEQESDAANAPPAASKEDVLCGCPWSDKGAGLVRHRVAQWYVPGLERDHRGEAAAAEKATAPAAQLASLVAEVASVAIKGPKKMKKDRMEEAASTADAEASKTTASPATATATDESPPAAGAIHDAQHDSPAEGKAHLYPEEATARAAAPPHAQESTTSAKGSSHAASRADTSLSAPETAAAPASDGHATTPTAKEKSESRKVLASESKTNKADHDDAKMAPTETKTGSPSKATAATPGDGKNTAEDTDDEALPKALLTVQANRNKRLKRLLVASLGTDFAKAGLRNDGLRTSFSVVNYQTIKQLTGLSHIPSALLISCLVAPQNEFSWVDISMHPTATLSEYKEALEEVLIGLDMHRTMVEDSAEPMLLPQVTVTKGCYSLLMRYAIEAPADKQMDSFQDLTNRFTLFVTQTKMITVHRTQCAYVEELKLNWQQYLSGEGLSGTPNTHRDASGLFVQASEASAKTPRGMRYLLYYFVKETVGTFTQAISKCIVEFDQYEANLFNTQRNRSAMARDIYHIKRRASVYGRTLTLTQDAYTHIATALHISSSNVGYQEIVHDLAHVESLAEELNANADSVLQLLFQLSSYQVNELMRVLTVFSAFFIPLSFIAAVYGMNFEDLPMLHNDHGGAFCAALMVTVASCIFMWFRANRFI